LILLEIMPNARRRREIKMKRLSVEWKTGPREGWIEVIYASLDNIKLIEGQGEVQFDKFSVKSKDRIRLEILVDKEDEEHKKRPMITVHEKTNTFTFYISDACKKYPIFIPAYEVIVTEGDDLRSYAEIENEIMKKGLCTALQQIEQQPEESYENAASVTRKMTAETFLGISRDIRIFSMDFRENIVNPNEVELMDWIQPRNHGYRVKLKQMDDADIKYRYLIGRGLGPKKSIRRRLEDDVLPILHFDIEDEDVTYHGIAFATLERSALKAGNIIGTHFLIADSYGHGCMQTEEQKRIRDKAMTAASTADETTVLFCRICAANNGKVPRYAWIKIPEPNGSFAPSNIINKSKFEYEEKTGFGVFENGEVFCISKLNGEPCSNKEISILVNPGESIIYEFIIPHSPISRDRAEMLAKQDFKRRHEECCNFWKQKIDSAVYISIPEKRIDSMIKAGMLHLDLITYGIEPDEPLAAMIGEYCPIGTESAPIIQFMDSIGWHNTARRSLDYFFEKQHDNGFMQNFGGYMLETGAALWCMGEHFRYTGDTEWVKEHRDKLIKACRFLYDWSQRNKTEELRGKGYGLMEGKVADPEDAERTFMLNGYAYIGLKRVAEMLEAAGCEESHWISKEADELKEHIRTAFFEVLENGPVVPIGDGSWCPTVAPWVGHHGLVCLHGDVVESFTHGAVALRDSLLGPLYLVFQEVISPYEQAASFMLNYNTELMCSENVAFSQPYYSRHPWIHLKRNEVKAFLKCYYNAVSSLSDRETFTFLEHEFEASSPHKTHEEGWFLMETRWMLYMEDENVLRILPGIPRKWMENGKTISIRNAASYFGKFSIFTESRLDEGYIKAVIECRTERKPQKVEIRLPHPEEKPAINVNGGRYIRETESVCIDQFEGYAEVLLEF